MFLSTVLAEKELTVSTAEARRYIMSGIVFVNDEQITNPGFSLTDGTHRIERRGKVIGSVDVLIIGSRLYDLRRRKTNEEHASHRK